MAIPKNIGAALALGATGLVAGAAWGAIDGLKPNQERGESGFGTKELRSAARSAIIGGLVGVGAGFGVHLLRGQVKFLDAALGWMNIPSSKPVLVAGGAIAGGLGYGGYTAVRALTD